MIKKLQRYSLLLSVLCHLLLLGSFTVIMTLNPIKNKKTPSLYIPSYVYHDDSTPVDSSIPSTEKSVQTSENGIEHLAATNSHVVPHFNRQEPVPAAEKNTEPVHLIGEDKIEKPLLTLIGKALTAHLSYPKIAVDFNLRGTVLVGFLLHPDGQLSDIQLMRTSSAGVLDRAAIDAVHAISPLPHTDRYLQKPEFLVIGIIFG